KIDFSHNPFSMPNIPVEEFIALDPRDNEKILSIKAIQYDIVCNGIELSSGAIRNHRPEVMKKAFAIAGYSEDVLEKKFGGMLHALSLGAPPHGGIAPGGPVCGDSARRRPDEGGTVGGNAQGAQGAAQTAGTAEEITKRRRQSR